MKIQIQRPIFARVLSCSIILSAWIINAQTLIDRYQLNEASGTVAHDSAGGNDGILSGAAVFVGGGINGGNALSLNNTNNNSFVSLGTFHLPNFFTDFSIVAWVKTTQLTGGAVVSNNQSGHDNGFLLGINDIYPGAPFGDNFGKLGNAVFDVSEHPWSGDSIATSTSISVDDGYWHQIVGIYQATNLTEIAFDGTIQGVVPTRFYVDPNNSYVIGGSDDGGNSPAGSFTGLIDDVQIYIGALSAGQVQYLYSHPGQTLASATLSAPAHFASGQFQMLLTGFSNRNYTLQMSTNLASNNWVSLYITNNPIADSFIVTDPTATNSQRFYRVLVGP
jgi:hypothetical protein